MVELDLVADGGTLVVAVAKRSRRPSRAGRPGVRAGWTTRASGEGGIGLGLVRQVARARGGEARLASAGGDGELGGAVFVGSCPGVLEEGGTS